MTAASTSTSRHDAANAVRPTSTEAVLQNHLRAATVGADAFQTFTSAAQ